MSIFKTILQALLIFSLTNFNKVSNFFHFTISFVYVIKSCVWLLFIKFQTKLNLSVKGYFQNFVDTYTSSFREMDTDIDLWISGCSRSKVLQFFIFFGHKYTIHVLWCPFLNYYLDFNIVQPELKLVEYESLSFGCSEAIRLIIKLKWNRAFKYRMLQ